MKLLVHKKFLSHEYKLKNAPIMGNHGVFSYFGRIKSNKTQDGIIQQNSVRKEVCMLSKLLRGSLQ